MKIISYLKMSKMKNEEDSNINVPNKEENKQLKENIVNNIYNNYIISEIYIDENNIKKSIRIVKI